MIIKAWEGKTPSIHPRAYLAENVTVVGDVTVEEGASLWYGAVIRADFTPIRIGKNTCVEDNAVLHAGTDIRDDCVIGHGAILHRCVVEPGCLIGMGAILLDGVVVGAGSIVAAGSLVVKNLSIPPGSMVMGSPATVTKALSQKERDKVLGGVATYRMLAQTQLPAFEEIK